MHSTSRMRRVLWLFSVILAIVFLDQWLKQLMVNWIGPTASVHRHEVVGRLLAFEYLENRGGAFGIFQQGTIVLWLISLVVIAVGLVVVLRIAFTDLILAVGISLIIGGAIGNAIDRITRGYVVDYIAVGRFWKFNLADAVVTLGALLTFVLLWRKDSAIRNAHLMQEHDS